MHVKYAQGGLIPTPSWTSPIDLAAAPPGCSGPLLRYFAGSQRIGVAMSEEDDWEFAGTDDAKATIRAAVRYLLKGTAGSDRGDIVREIIEIVSGAASGLPPGGKDPLDEDMPGG
jgi:hypothetical protein